jgi:hypothetical protein
MSRLGLTTPESSEYAPHYARYISLVPNDDIVGLLDRQSGEMAELLSGISDEEANFRYAPEKWTVKQVLGHIIDTERVLAYRALRIARNDQTPIEGFEQDDYVKYGPCDSISLTELLREYTSVRQATALLFRHLKPDAWNRRGTANHNEVTVRALAYIVAGHQIHHCQILREKYLSRLGEIGQVVGKP